MGWCGPFCLKSGQDPSQCNYTHLIGNTNVKVYGGTRCTYAGQDSLGSFFPGLFNYFVDPAIRSCRPPGYVQLGSGLNRDLSLISSTPRSRVAVLGTLVQITNALSNLQYVTRPYYNRFYRPPVNQRDPVTFNIDTDSTDSLNIVVNDLGNSGGMGYSPQIATESITILVAAVNNPPVAHGPSSIYATEDHPFNFEGITTGLSVSDPDSGDYGFSSGIFTVNMSCVNGRLFLNETFLEETGVSTVRITYKNWADPRLELRGLHTVVNALSSPIFGSGCQTKIQCSDGSKYTSSDTKYGFYKSAKYGVVYSPTVFGGPAIGCGFCPEDAGNKFLSIEGVMDDINLALSLVTYLPDPNFNTRILGSSDTIVFNVSDNGDMGNDASAPALTDSLSINIVVESVNDRPIVGRAVEENRYITSYLPPTITRTKVSDTALLAINRSLDTFCSDLRPSGSEYFTLCGPTVRQYIDIDEGATFVITPDVFWVFDVDAQEAENMATPRRFCCPSAVANDGGCFCAETCSCKQPPVCSATFNSMPPGLPGQVLINMSSSNGLLSFYPPPGRSVYPTNELLFLTNLNGLVVGCPNQLACMRNVSWIALLTSLSSFQEAVTNYFLTYRGKQYFYGRDVISIRVSDQGFTDECYSDVLTTTETVDVRVVAVNNPPVIVSDFSVVSYAQGLRCYVDYMSFPRLAGTEGLDPTCANTTDSNLPPGNAGNPLQFYDVDMDASKYGNMTLIFTVGSLQGKHTYAGNLFLVQIIAQADIWYEQFRNSDGFRVFSIQGVLKNINNLMSNLRYDADPIFAGYVPIFVVANDMGNYGECDGNHVCGAKEVTCPNHTQAGSHNPPIQGITSTQIDVVIQAPKQCVVTSESFRSDCDSCNLIAGCGWCPGFCGVGKCMIDGGSQPLFEPCEVGPDGRGWKTCENPSGQLWELLVVIIVPMIGIFGIMLLLFRWMIRRYGSFPSFGKHIQATFARYCQKMHLMPSKEANWLQFFSLVICAAVIIFVVLNRQLITPQCLFQSEFYLDSVTSVTVTSDNCMIRFVPSRYKGYPDNLLPQPKIKVAYTNDPLIILESHTCGSQVSFAVTNDRDSSTKYIGYYCNIEIVVPDRIVMPDVTIIAAGDNTTTVRAGSMDIDSPNFGLDFGPNTFSLQGNDLIVRLENISSKYFEYNVEHGELIATDLSATTLGTFKSEDADMIVATTLQSHVEFWQKENNLVCLTAAPGSLYVDNSCVLTCRYPNITETLDLRSTMEDGTTIFSDITNLSNLKRQVFNSDPWLCTGKVNVNYILNCTLFNPVEAEANDTCPVGAKYSEKSQVPLIVGCYDLELCTLNESPQCLCKPYCDMANLNPPGTCDEFGRCCQDICGGYSKADMFPIANVPRCGSTIDPISMPWCNGSGMQQNYIFTSTSGQIALEVLDASWNTSVSSYRGGAEMSDASPGLGIQASDLPILETLFHPNGAFSPEVDVFYFILSGPGTVNTSVGQFAWVGNVQYLIFDSFFLDFFSFGILAPRVASSQITLKPGFCPFDVQFSTPQFNQRLIEMQTLLLNTLQSVPPTTPIPSGSLLVFEGANGVRVFYTDPNSNEPTLVYFQSSQYSLSLIVVYLAIAIPAVVSLIFVLTTFSSYSAHLNDFRRKKLEEQRLTKNINILLQPNKIMDEADYDEMARNQRALIARTNLFYMFEESFADPEEQRTVLADFCFVVLELVVVLSSSTVVFYGAKLLKNSYQSQACENRADYCSCLMESSMISKVADTLITLVYIYFLFAIAEMSAHYLCFKLTLLTKLLRGIFLLFFFVLNGLSLFYLSTIVIFILLGVLIRPQSSIPYAIAVVGTIGCTMSLQMKLQVHHENIESLVRKSVSDIEEQKMLADLKLPRALLALFKEKNLVKALRNLGVSSGNRILYSAVFASCLVITYAFLIVGFQAFTDMNKTLNSVINSLLVIVLALLGQIISNSIVDESQVCVKADEAMQFLRKVFRILLNQIAIAEKLIGNMQSHVNDPALGEME